jgi:hypothetical protein
VTVITAICEPRLYPLQLILFRVLEVSIIKARHTVRPTRSGKLIPSSDNALSIDSKLHECPVRSGSRDNRFTASHDVLAHNVELSFVRSRDKMLYFTVTPWR